LQDRAESSFVTGEGTLGLPAVFVLLLWESAMHLTTVLGLWNGRAATGIDGNHGRTDAAVLAGQAVIGFAVEGPVGEEPIGNDGERRLKDGGSELRAVVTGAATHRGGGEEVTAGVADHRQFGPEAGDRLTFAAEREVARNRSTIETGGIDGRLRVFLDQAAFDCGRSGAVKEDDEVPLFKSRCSA
jgi:hypothetical protein